MFAGRCGAAETALPVARRSAWLPSPVTRTYFIVGKVPSPDVIAAVVSLKRNYVRRVSSDRIAGPETGDGQVRAGVEIFSSPAAILTSARAGGYGDMQ